MMPDPPYWKYHLPNTKPPHILPVPELRLEKVPEGCLCRNIQEPVEQTVPHPSSWAFSISGHAASTHHSVPGLSFFLSFFFFFSHLGLSVTARTRPDLRRMVSWKCQGMNNPPCPPLSRSPSETDRSGGIDIPAPLPLCWDISEVCVQHCFPEIHSRAKVYSAQWNKLNYTAPLLSFFPSLN